MPATTDRTELKEIARSAAPMLSDAELEAIVDGELAKIASRDERRFDYAYFALGTVVAAAAGLVELKYGVWLMVVNVCLLLGLKRSLALVAIVGAGVLWYAGVFDAPLSKVKLNAEDCVTNLASGVTLCGQDMILAGAGPEWVVQPGIRGSDDQPADAR